MEQNNSAVGSTFKLNYKRTFLIGFAFFGILLLWQVYDSQCSTFLTELFKEAFGTTNNEDVQYLVGIMMAIDNLAALILLPIFGNLSDKTHTKIGKRMPYILVGTFVCAIAFPFIPLLFHYHNLAGVVSMMAIVVIFAMMYRNPAVSLMPDMTPKPLRSKANAIINIMGYIGGACATILLIFLTTTKYLYKNVYDADGNLIDKINLWSRGEANLWIIEIPFIVASVLMIISAVVLFILVKENKIEEEMKDEMRRGEEYAALNDKIQNDDAPLTKENKTMLILILVAEFCWFMSDNGISTFMNNYVIYYLGVSSGNSQIATIVGGVGSVIGFVIGGYLAGKIGRKWTIFTGLGLTLVSLMVWMILSYALPSSGSFPFYLFIIWGVKGFGMSLVHVNSYPMVVELCSSKKIGRFTGLYYAASMAAQTITPVALGSLLLLDNFTFRELPVYALACVGVSLIIFIFVKNVKTNKTDIKKGIEALDVED